MDGAARTLLAHTHGRTNCHSKQKIRRPATGNRRRAGTVRLGLFGDRENSFPQELLDKLVKRANCREVCLTASAILFAEVILDQLARRRHMKTGFAKPGFYTSTLTPCSGCLPRETFVFG